MSDVVQSADRDVRGVLAEFERRSGITGVEHEIKQRPDGPVLIIKMANPTERFYRILQEIRTDGSYATLQKSIPSNHLQSPEAKYFLRILTESLNVNRFSFKEDFFARYTNSVSNAEGQITASANHIVFGRRGAGKSSLLLYALRSREPDRKPSAWIDMQVYEKRTDECVILDILSDALRQLEAPLGVVADYSRVLKTLERYRQDPRTDEPTVRQFLPDVRALFSELQAKADSVFLFLDDFHVVAQEFQAKLLGLIYSVTRGTNIFLKLSAIESFTRSWDAAGHTGLQVPHDAQAIKLDYNLTMPDKAATHIEGILDAHAAYSGLPSVKFLCTSPDVIPRLIWVSAGVPRDALYMFAQAMTRGSTTNRSRVSVTNVNLAASEMVSQKMRDLDFDVPAPSEEEELSTVIERIKEFCIKQQRRNAFLVEIVNDGLYDAILKLVDLRLLHVISEGITVGEAGRKYLALILDYGFYTGVRAAQSVDLFNKQTQRVTYKQLRRLPVLPRVEG